MENILNLYEQVKDQTFIGQDTVAKDIIDLSSNKFIKISYFFIKYRNFERCRIRSRKTNQVL